MARKYIGRGPTRRTTKRLAGLRVDNPKALPGVKADNRYTPQERRKVLKASSRAKANRPRPAKKPAPYSPTAPLTGRREKTEMAAAERLQFGPQRRELDKQIGQQAQTAANTGSYFDDYKAALGRATERINLANQAAATSQQAQVDASADLQQARVEQRDKEQQEQAAKLGFNQRPVSQEGHQAVAAQRAQGTAQVGSMRTQGAADTALMEKRGATAVLGKAEAMTREAARGRQLQQESRDLEDKRGAFRTDFRRQTRKDEREWAAIRKEFGLKEKEIMLDAGATRAQQQTERQKAAAQKIVARIYASADRAGARAQIRVAKLQLEKGKISKRQYRHIVNEYRGLPKKPSSFDFNYNGVGGGGGGGKGKGGKSKLQTWERDKIDVAVRSLKAAGADGGDRVKMVQRLIERGNLPPRLARIAWREYLKRHKTPDRPGNAPAPGGSRPT